MFINSILSKYFDADTIELFSKSSSYLVIRIIGTAFTFTFSYYVIKIFGLSDYGLISLGFTFFLIISVVGRLGLDLNIVRHFSVHYKSSEYGLFYKSILATFLLTSLLSFVAYLSKDYIVNYIFQKPKPQLIPYLNWILPSIPFWSVNLLSAHFLRARKMNNWFVFFNNAGRYVFSLIILFIVLQYVELDSIYVVKCHLIAIIALSIISTYIAFRQMKYIGIQSKTDISSFIKESLPIMYSSTINIIINWIGIFILGIYSTTQDIAIFEIGLKISLLLTFVVNAFNSILAPKIARRYFEKDLSQVQKLVSISTNINFLSGIALTIVILIFNQELLSLFGSDDKDSFWLIVILCLGQLIGCYCGSVGIILQMTNNQKIYQYLMLISFVVIITSMLLLVPRYGVIGASLSFFLSMFLWNIIGAIFIKKKLNITSYFTLRIKYK